MPLDHEDLLITARVRPSFHAIESVTLRYRIMFDDEISVPMFDDGAHGDGAAGDGWYGASIPANLSTNGQMIRYFVSATDVNSNASRWPLFTNPTNTEEYLGTIVNPTNLASKLPIFHLFVAPGQLADEMAAGSWYVVDGRADDAFSDDPAPLWRQVLRRQPPPLTILSTYPAELGLN